MTGEILSEKKADADQPTIEQYPEAKSLDINRNFEGFKALLIRWIVCCHIAFFQFENAYFRQLLFFLYPGLYKFLPRVGNTIRK